MGERHPDRAAEPCRLDHQPGVAAARGEGLELGQDRIARGRPALGADLDPVHDRQADAAAHALEERLVHADRRCRDAGAGVGQVGRLEQRLDRAVLAERPVEPDHDDRRGDRRRQPVDRGTDLMWSVGIERSGLVVVALRAASADMIGRQPPPPAVEVEEDLRHRVTALAERVGDGRARHDRHVVLGGRPAEEHRDRLG